MHTIFWAFWDFVSVWNFTDFSEIIFAGTYLRGFLGDFGEPKIVYKIETPVWMSGFDNQTTVSILKQGSKTNELNAEIAVAVLEGLGAKTDTALQRKYEGLKTAKKRAGKRVNIRRNCR